MNGGLDKRKIIWIIIIISVTIPIVIELVTFTGLIFNNNREDSISIDSGKSSGDEILQQTPQIETIKEAVVINRGGRWVFNFDIEVNNTSSERYTIKFLDIITKQGTQNQGIFTQEIPPKQKKLLKTNWTIPEGEIPSQIRFRVSYNNQTKDGTINLTSIPVQTKE